MTGPRIAWYGDDFTGSAAVLETLAVAGLKGVLFLDLPPEGAGRGMDAIGIAGMSRTWSPAEMTARLPAVFDTLDATGAAILHYKICSTLDSAPGIGSIGTAIDIARTRWPEAWIPLFPASPAIGRHQAFGTLFARSGNTIHRLDRHPVMSCHPVTPMDEADVRLHVGRQTGERIGLVDLLDLADADPALDRLLAGGTRVIALDAVDAGDLARVGRLIGTRGPLVAFGSQGIEEALVAHWREAGQIGAGDVPAPVLPAARVLGLSGSFSQVTQQQLRRAEAADAVVIRIDTDETQAVELAVHLLAAGNMPIVATAVTAMPSGDDLGNMLGRIAAGVMARTRVDRIVVAGGDTSGSVCRGLGIGALTFHGRLAPGAGLFMALAADMIPRGFEIALKGGQMGAPDYFVRMRNGSASSAAS